jgi:hypothetical protein
VWFLGRPKPNSGIIYMYRGTGINLRFSFL